MEEMMIKLAVQGIALALMVSLAGCASIVSESSWPVTIQSNPAGAKCVVSDKNGTVVQGGETPMTAVLNSSDGFFSAASYSVACQKDGYRSTITMEAHLNGWYWGNIVFGGAIGMLIVDPASGAMWRMDDTQVVQVAQQEKAAELK
jgi:hypothetical protein